MQLQKNIWEKVIHCKKMMKKNRMQKIEKNFIIVYLGKSASYLGTDDS